MKLGLLQCDHVAELLLPIAGDLDQMFSGWLDADWKVYDVTRGALPSELGECDAWLTTGSRASVYDDEPWIHGLAEVVRRLQRERRVFFGVCFGHQMMAHALGGRVAKCARGWGIGVHTFKVSRREEWMQPPAAEFSVLMSCQDQVDRLPPGARVLAGNEHCPVGMYRLQNMVGIQGHPEWNAAYARVLLEARRERIGSERVAKAMQTLDRPLDGALIAAWASRFVASVRSRDPEFRNPGK